MAWLLSRLGRNGGGGVRLEAKGAPGHEEWEGEVLSSYSVGPARYTLYRRGGFEVRLRVEEPEPVPGDARLKALIAGLDEPRDEVERYYVEKARSGYGPIYPLVIDPNVEEIAVEGEGRPVAVIHKGVPGVWITVDVNLDSHDLDGLVLSVARRAGRSLSVAAPMAEGLTAEGFRIAATFAREVTRFGSTLVLRKYPEKPVTLGDLVASRVLSPLMAAYLWILVEAQSFLIITGNMGAGKTTLLQSLANLIPPFLRVVTIEDTPEIRLDTPHWDSLVTRPSLPGEQLEPIELEDLLKFALRRRAEYIIVGEVRGREARLLAQAAASGHGSMTTMHASGPEGALLRLRMEPISLPQAFLQLVTAIVHVKRVNLGLAGVKRRVTSIAEVDGDEIVRIFAWDPRSDSFTPSTAEEVAEVSARIREAAAALPYVVDPVEELEERARVLEKAAAMGGDAVRRAVRLYYEKRYGA